MGGKKGFGRGKPKGQEMQWGTASAGSGN